MDKTLFHSKYRGKQVEAFTLVNAGQMRCNLTNYGARIVSLWIPNGEGHLEDVVLGFDSLQEYLDTDQAFFGAVVGRFANRIALAKFRLEDEEVQLNANLGKHHLHGGQEGFHHRVWDVIQQSPSCLTMSYQSAHGEEGYPGTLNVKVTYELRDDNSLAISYSASTDRTTVLNLTNHSYFNLNGAGNGSIVNHELRIFSEAFTEVDEELIPSGRILPIEGTVLDFRTPRSIGSQLIENDPLLKESGGFDHNYVLEGKGYRSVASVYAPSSGRSMEVLTDQPGLQFYSGNSLDGKTVGKGGKAYGHRSAFCLETQHFPDSPNHPEFPDTTLRPGETFSSLTVYRFWSEE